MSRYEQGYRSAIVDTLESVSKVDEELLRRVHSAANFKSKLQSGNVSFIDGLIDGYDDWSLYSPTLSFGHKSFVTERAIDDKQNLDYHTLKQYSLIKDYTPMPDNKKIQSVTTLKEAYELGEWFADAYKLQGIAARCQDSFYH